MSCLMGLNPQFSVAQCFYKYYEDLCYVRELTLIWAPR